MPRRSWRAVLHATAMTSTSGIKRRSGSQFNPQWECDYLFTAVANGVQCLVCSKVNSTVRKYHLERHYKACHSSEYDDVVGDDREALLNRLREENTAVHLIEPVIMQEINDEAENTTDANNDFDTEKEEVHKRKPEEHLEFSLPKRPCVQTKDQEDPKNLDPSEKKLRDDCRIFGEHVANKLSTYDSRIQAIVQHQINNILFEADMGRYSHSVPEQWSLSPATSPSPQKQEAVLVSSPAPHSRQETSSDLQLALPHSSSSQPYLEVVKEEERVMEQHLPHSESLEEEMISVLRSPRHLDTNTELHGTDNSICNESYNKAVESHLQTICDTVSKLTGKRPSLQKENEFDIFGRSVAIQLQTLPFVLALETQLKLQSILTEMRLKTNYCESVSLRNGIPTIVAPT